MPPIRKNLWRQQLDALRTERTSRGSDIQRFHSTNATVMTLHIPSNMVLFPLIVIASLPSSCRSAFLTGAALPASKPFAIPHKLFSATVPILTNTPTNSTQWERFHSSEKPAANYGENKELIKLNQNLNKWAERAGSIHETSAVACAARAEELWRANPDLADTVSFNSVLKAWSRCAQSLAEQKKIPGGVENYDSESPPLPNDPKYAVYTPSNAAQHATDLLFETEQVHDENVREGGSGTSLLPDVLSYNSVLDGWAKSRDPHSPEQIEGLIQRMKQKQHLQPDSLSYNALIDAYAYSSRPDRIPKLHTLWEEMESLASKQATSGPPRVKPSVRTINSILHAYSRMALEEPDSAIQYTNKAMEIFSAMKKRYEETGDPGDRPDVMTYTTVMECLARCTRGKKGAQFIQQAQDLFTELKSLYDESGDSRFCPSVYTYATLIKVWSKSSEKNSAERAEEILDEIITIGQSKYSIQPNDMVFTGVIQAWARARSNENKAKHALDLLLRMRSLEPPLQPTLVNYNMALDACARTMGDAAQQMAALKIAFAIFKAVEQNSHPNHVTFATLLKCVGNLLPPGNERNNVTKAVFEKAVHAGQVETAVIINLQKAADANLIQTLLKDATARQAKSNLGVRRVNAKNFVDFSSIPTSWRRNVKL